MCVPFKLLQIPETVLFLFFSFPFAGLKDLSICPVLLHLCKQKRAGHKQALAVANKLRTRGD